MTARKIAFPVRGYDTVMAELPRERIAAGVMAAMAAHEPERYEEWGGGYRCQCRDRSGSRREWPCPEVRAIVAALSGEEAPS